MVSTAPHAALRAPDAEPPTGRETRPGSHLWQVDVVRLLTFSAVIAVHLLAFTQQPDNRVAAGAMMLLQYGREVFYALTGFVLVHSTWGRPLKLRSFWRKRVTYVAVPYVTWSAIYYAYSVLGHQHLQPSLSGFGWDLLYGGAMYHLYFLLVTIQLYLAFPLIMWFVRRTAHRAGLVLGVVAVANLAWLGVLQYVTAPSGGAGQWMFAHGYEILPTYAMYILGGCYAAVHLPALQRFVDSHTRPLLAAAAAATAGALLAYALQLQYMAPRTANAVTQPAMALSCLAAVIVVYIVGCRWSEGRRKNQKTIEVLSDASFGVYLSHPLILAFLLDYAGFGNNSQHMPSILATLSGYVIVVVGATAVTLLARRSPLSLPLAGRPWRAAVKRQPAAARAADRPERQRTAVGQAAVSITGPVLPTANVAAEGAGS